MMTRRETPAAGRLRDYSTGPQRWAAVLRSDRGADEAFIYAVLTTGIYCRPSCAAPRPKRDNTRFFDTPAEAERAGFRACRRCRPDRGSADPRSDAIVEACRMIEAAEEVPSLDALARACGLSPFHFHRLFKAAVGITPKSYAAALRRGRLQAALVEASTVTEAIYQAGYASSGRFYGESAAVLGMTPTRYRQGGEGATIRFAIGACALGQLLVAASGIGICSIRFGDDPQALVRELEDRFPKAELIGGDPAFERTAARVMALVDDPGRGLDLPLDIRGTAFQERVWQALREIPAGSTASYAELAARIGRPEAVRAVARACAANELALAIPCHRVVRRDGALAGYRWGVERKRALLAREGAPGHRATDKNA